ncbi:MAG: hypothetical protein AAFV07_20510, partial [Bacteroidota bacterium]
MQNALAFLLCLFGSTLWAQPNLPVLHARSPTLSIQDGETMRLQYWTASPEIPLDVYEADRINQVKTVAFISDIDTLDIRLEPGTVHDFWVILAN